MQGRRNHRASGAAAHGLAPTKEVLEPPPANAFLGDPRLSRIRYGLRTFPQFFLSF